MPMPILETKLYMAPLRPEVVPRPALIERLGAGLQRKLTLVSAPAGSGKSTLVSAWLQGLDRTAAWLSLDEGDNAPVRFFAHLFAALGQVDGVRRSAQDLLQASPSPQPDALVAALINDIAGDAEPFVLVLDDYHTIHELAIHDAVGLLLDRQPPELHLVIVTRHDPPLPLSRLRARGQLTEIRQSDLRFRHDEAAVFLRQAMGLPLTDADIAALEERTEGWITGLQLAALSMQGRDEQSVAGFIEGFSGRHHFVLDYLTDEVLKRQPEALQRFLLHTSILERMSGPLCDALMEREEEAAAKRLAAGEAVTSSETLPRQTDGETLPRQTDGETLQQLDAANLFVVPLDDERNWYRYHNLFAELLRARLQETDADQVPGLHRRAAAWYEEHGFGPDAVHHALASGDDDLAADVVQRQIMQLATWSRLDVATLLGWLQALPEHVVRRRPWLWLFTFRAMFASGRLEESMRVLDELEQALPRQTDGETLQGDRSLPDAQRVLQLAAADRASLAATRGNVAVVEAFAKRYLAQAQEDDTTGRLRAVAAVGMAHYRSGNMAKARRAFREAIDLALAAKLPVVVVPFLCNLAEVQIAQGQLRQALETCQQAEQVGTLQGTRIASAGFVGVVKAHILYQQNDLQGAERNALDGLALLSRGGIAEQFGNIHAVLAQVRQAQGDQQGAQAAIEWAAQLAQGGVMPRLKHQVEAHQARIWLAQGQVQRAVEWARQYAQVGETLPRQSDGETMYLREFEDLTLAQVWLAEGRAERALAVLDGLLASARAAGRQGSAIEIQAARAVALQALRRVDEALAALEPALSLGQPEGYVRAFVDLGEPMRALLKRVASRGVAPAYVARLLAAYEMTTEAWAEQPTPAEQPLVEPLSERELEVLQLLAEGLSNKEIGQRLFISLPTVKSHTRNIYGKLGVHSRREAVGRAQALGMLP
jgi:LuxR family maltose regulon positive regulatory protein